MHAVLLVLSLLAAEGEKTVTLRGAVKDAAGKPVVGALVLAADPTPGGDRSRQCETNDRGEFTLEGALVSRDVARLLAYKPGHAIGMVTIDSEERLSKPVEIKLAAAEPLTLIVLDPQGMPLAGAEIPALDYESGGTWHTATDWKGKLARAADANGQVTIDYLPAKSSSIVTVKTANYGIQRRQVTAEPADRTIRLRPVGRLEGRVLAADPKAVAGLTVEVYTISGAPNDGAGYAQLKTDTSGRFTIEHLAEGDARISVQVDRSQPFRLTGETKAKVSAGKTSTIDIQLVKAARVTGKVVEQGTQKPIAGVKLYLSNRVESEQIVTDAEGSFTVYFGPGSIYGNLGETPKGYFSSPFLNLGGEIGPETTELTLKAIELPRSIQRMVTVVDEQGKPAGDAWVDATWVLKHDRYTTIVTRSAKTDEHGKCNLELLPETAEVYLRASTNERAGDLVASTVGAPMEIRLTVTSANSAILAGRVVDQAGKPIAQAFVRIQSGEYRSLPRGYTGDMGTQWMVRTDDEGRFQSPHPLPRNLPLPKTLTTFRPDSGYLITVEAPGKLPSVTRFPLLDGASPLHVPDIVLEEAKRIVGRVVDAEGRPIEGVQIRAEGRDQSRTAKGQSGPDGRFELSGIHPQAKFFFAARADYRFTGMPIPASGEVQVTLQRRDAQAVPLAPVKISSAEVRDRLRKVLTPVYEKYGAKLHPAQRSRILELLARHDPDYVINELSKVAEGNHRAELLIKLGQLDDAAAAAATNKTPWWRSYSLLHVSQVQPNVARRREILAEVLLQAKGVIEPDRRLGLICNVAEELFDLGDKAAAKRLVDDHLKEIESLEPGFYRGYLAETVALFDVDKALKLCEGATDEYERDRHPGNIAHELAAIDPARAEAILKSISPQGLYRYAPRVAYRMASVDLPRTRRIVELIPASYPDQRQHALGLVALAVCGKDADEARRVLRQAFDQVDAESTHRQGNSLVVSSMALVAISEEVDPDATREYVWRTLALLPASSESPDAWSREQQRQQEAKAAILLQRYGLHPEIAAELVEPLFAHGEFKSHDPNQTAGFYAMALADADRSANWLEAYIARTKEDSLKYIPQPWELMGEALGGDDQAFWNSLHERVLHLWVVDKEDL